MDIRLLPCAFYREPTETDVPNAQPLTTFVVRGADGAGPLAIDGGSIGLVGDARDMAQIREVILTHAHLDHVATLPMWIEALVSEKRTPVPVHASKEVVEVLRQHVFNGAVFPDFEELRDDQGRALMEYRLVPDGDAFSLAGFELHAFRTDHPVTTHGYVVDDGRDAVVFGADSGPCDALWEAVRAHENVRAVVMETSFPDFMEPIARASGHLTPALLREELTKAPRDIKVLITHLKPAYRDGISRAIRAFDDPRIEILSPGRDVEITAC